MSESATYAIPKNFADAHITEEIYQTLYQQSLEDPNTFWKQQAESLITWEQSWTKISDCDLSQGYARWFVGAKLNVSVNCIDRHLPKRSKLVDLPWDGHDPKESQSFTHPKTS